MRPFVVIYRTEWEGSRAGGEGSKRNMGHVPPALRGVDRSDTDLLLRSLLYSLDTEAKESGDLLEIVSLFAMSIDLQTRLMGEFSLLPGKIPKSKVLAQLGRKEEGGGEQGRLGLMTFKK